MQIANGSAVTLEEYDATKPEHKSQFAALNREWLEKYFYVEPHDEVMFADPEGILIAKGGWIGFARAEGGLIVGTCGLKALEPGCYEVVRMAVTHDWQKQKIGERLLVACLERARMLQAKKLYIVSNTSLIPAIKLYRRYGFTDSPENRHADYARGDITLELDLR